jgi:DNA-binding XRE family transcriptional regulator
MCQNLSLPRSAVAKMLHVSLRTLHNWESGKVRIPYAAYKLIRLFNSYEIFHPIWKDWRICGSRLITPEGHALEAGNFHWLSLMARRAEAFSKVNQRLIAQKRAADCQALLATAPSVIETNNQSLSNGSSGLVYNSTSGKLIDENQLNQGLYGNSLERFPKLPKLGLGDNHPAPTPDGLPVRLQRAFLTQQLSTGGAL